MSRIFIKEGSPVGNFPGGICRERAKLARGCVGFLCAVLLLFPTLTPARLSGDARFEASLIPICKIQGDVWTSPYDGKLVRTRGIVYLDLDDTSQRGFFLQQGDCDADPSTSDGLFVYLGGQIDVVRQGDWVEVQGLVGEYYAMTEISASPEDITILSRDNPLPPAVELSPPFSNDQAWRYFESLEGMRVGLPEALVVGPTSLADESFVVRADLGIQRVFRDDPAGTGEIVCVDDGGLAEIAPEVKVGDRVVGLLGALEYSLGAYRLQLSASPSVYPAQVDHDEADILEPSPSLIRAASFNLANLFDTFDDPHKDDTVLSAAEYQRRLAKRALAVHQSLGEPDLIAVQEVENGDVLDALLHRPEIENDYGFVWIEGPDTRGIDVALLYRQDRFTLLGSQVYQGCTTLLDGLGPDGNRDMAAPHNAVTCDSDGDGVLDGNRLFSRPPLAVRLRMALDGAEGLEMAVLVNHWKSKIEDTPYAEYTLPRRLEQAQFTFQVVSDIRGNYPRDHLLLLGDLNDYPDSKPLDVLKASGLDDLSSRISPSQRYTYIHQGVSQVLDYALVGLRPPLSASNIQPLHINADYPHVFSGVNDVIYRSSDHDPLLVGLLVNSHFSFLPMLSR